MESPLVESDPNGETEPDYDELLRINHELSEANDTLRQDMEYFISSSHIMEAEIQSLEKKRKEDALQMNQLLLDLANCRALTSSLQNKIKELENYVLEIQNTSVGQLNSEKNQLKLRIIELENIIHYLTGEQ